jgi:hypothetical protein
MNAYGWGVQLYLCSFLTSTLDGGEWLTSRSGRFTPEKERQDPLRGRLDRPQGRSGLFGEEKSLIPEGIPTPGRLARTLVALFKAVFGSRKNTYLFDLKWGFTL